METSNPLLLFLNQAGPERMILLFVGALGLLTILNTSSGFLKWIWVTFLRPGKNLSKYGSWAIVTGPTDGIGRSFAIQLARRKINLVLVGRSPSKLKDLADELQAKYKTQVKTIVVDFTGDLIEGMNRVEEAINDLDVGILINNVGMSYPYARFFHEVDSQLLKNLIAVNIEGTTRMVHTVLPGMLKRKKGAIVNIGSGAATVIPSDPLYTVYAATKAYVDQFSRSLYVEYKHSGVDVQCQVLDEGTVMVKPVGILDQRTLQLRQQLVDQVKVQWDKYSPSSATWEDTEEMRCRFPYPFQGLRDEVYY